jgi:hypothetical protein
MAYVVRTKRGRFEARESRLTAAGPRSRTLVSFTELDPEAIEKARARADGPLNVEELRKSATRVGAPVAGEPVDDATRETLRLIANGNRPDPMLRRLLLDALQREERADGAPATGPTPSISAAARAAAEWIGAGATRRGEALRDLLLLGDALPVPVRSGEIGFPRLRSD